jgi:hypothetical protein
MDSTVYERRDGRDPCGPCRKGRSCACRRRLHANDIHLPVGSLTDGYSEQHNERCRPADRCLHPPLLAGHYAYRRVYRNFAWPSYCVCQDSGSKPGTKAARYRHSVAGQEARSDVFD